MIWIAAYLYVAGAMVALIASELSYQSEHDPRVRRSPLKYAVCVSLWPLVMPFITVSVLLEARKA